jgi:hypothetical protein
VEEGRKEEGMNVGKDAGDDRIAEKGRIKCRTGE